MDVGLDIDLLLHEKNDIDLTEPIKDPVLLTIGTENKKVLASMFIGTQINLQDHVYIKPFITGYVKTNSLGGFDFSSNLQFTSGLKAGWLF